MDQLEYHSRERRTASRTDNRLATDKTRTFLRPRSVAGPANVLKHKPGPALTVARNEMLSPIEMLADWSTKRTHLR